MSDSSIENAIDTNSFKTFQKFIFEIPMTVFVYTKAIGPSKVDKCYGYKIIDGYLHLVNVEGNVACSFSVGEWIMIRCQ